MKPLVAEIPRLQFCSLHLYVCECFPSTVWLLLTGDCFSCVGLISTDDASLRFLADNHMDALLSVRLSDNEFLLCFSGTYRLMHLLFILSYVRLFYNFRNYLPLHDSDFLRCSSAIRVYTLRPPSWKSELIASSSAS